MEEATIPSKRRREASRTGDEEGVSLTNNVREELERITKKYEDLVKKLRVFVVTLARTYLVNKMREKSACCQNFVEAPLMKEMSSLNNAVVQLRPRRALGLQES